MARKSRSYLANLVGAALLLYIILAEVWTLIVRALLRLPGAPAWGGNLAQLLFIILSVLPPLLLLCGKGASAGLRLSLGKGKIPIGILLPLFLGAMVAVNSCTNLLRALVARNLDLPAAQSAALPEDGTGKLLYFLTACVLAPILEELFFRGAVQGALRPYGTVLSITLSTLLFTLAHTNFWELPVVFVLGFIIGYMAEISGSVLPGMVLHAANNLVMFLILLEQERIGGIATLVLAFWMVFLFVALFIGALWVVTKRRMWPKFRLRRSASGTKKNAGGTQRGKRQTSALRRLLRQPVFLAGGLAMTAYCVLQVFTE